MQALHPWQLFLSLPSKSFLIKLKSLTGAQRFCDFYMYICLLLGRITTKPPLTNLTLILPALLLDSLFVFFFFFLSFRKWLHKSNLKVSRHACNRMCSESLITGTIEPAWILSGNSEPQPVFLARLSISLVFSGLPSSLFSAYIFLPPSVPC